MMSHNPYFNRWFSAIKYNYTPSDYDLSHNPYFNRWFSAMDFLSVKNDGEYLSQSLF